MIVSCRFYVRGGPNISHYPESSSNCIKNRQCGYISHKF